MKDLKLVIFDLDNTLLNRTQGAYRTYECFLREVLKINTDSVRSEAILNDLMNWDMYGNADKGFIMQQLRKSYGFEVDAAYFKQWWLDNLWRFEEVYPRSYEVLNKLKEKYQLALITSGDVAAQSSKLRHNHLEDYFCEILISENVGADKPDPAIYRLLLDKLQIKPEEAVFVGDTFSKDILGAARAGIRAIFIWPDDGRPSGRFAERIYQIEDLLNIL